MAENQTTAPTETEQLALRIANRIFYHVSDQSRRDALERLLIEFAAEIKRSAIEP